MSETFEFEFTTTATIRAGWAAWFMPIWDADTDTIAELEAGVAQVTPGNLRAVGGAVCAQPEGESWWLPCQPEHFATDEVHDDTHDLRARLFDTREEAEAHVRDTLDRFANPAPWESFVQL